MPPRHRPASRCCRCRRGTQRHPQGAHTFFQQKAAGCHVIGKCIVPRCRRGGCRRQKAPVRQARGRCPILCGSQIGPGDMNTRVPFKGAAVDKSAKGRSCRLQVHQFRICAGPAVRTVRPGPSRRMCRSRQASCPGRKPISVLSAENAASRAKRSDSRNCGSRVSSSSKNSVMWNTQNQVSRNRLRLSDATLAHQ